MTPRTQRILSASLVAAGLALVVMMVTREGELGALPLGLILAGAIGYFAAWMRERASRQR